MRALFAPATDLAAAIGVPDPARPGSECVIAFVQVKDEYRGDVTEEEYTGFLRGKVARHAVPRTVTFLYDMPVTDVSKIRKNELREMALRLLGPEGGSEPDK